MPSSFAIDGVDLHDGSLVYSHRTYYYYGTEYACGFEYGNPDDDPSDPWCGFGYSTAKRLGGPWSNVITLIDPLSIDPLTGTTWEEDCMYGQTSPGIYTNDGEGCFTARMLYNQVLGQWNLWFDAPNDVTRGWNAYYVLSCGSPTGPCDEPAGGTFLGKPALNGCGDANGAEALSPTDPPVLFCASSTTHPGESVIGEDSLNNGYGTGNTGAGGTYQQAVAGLTLADSPGVFWSPGLSTWVLTFTDAPGCGYCDGAPTGWAYSSTLTGDDDWTTSGSQARRDISANTCGGQNDTIDTVNGVAYQEIDLWDGSDNEANAGVWFEEMTSYDDGAPGQLYQPFTPWLCGWRGQL